jgi:hypothetical protein
MRARFRFALPLVLALLIGLFAAQPPAPVEADGETFQSLVTAINNGDMASAMQIASPDLTVTVPGGLTFRMSPGAQLPASILPITVVSVTSEGAGSQTLDAVLMFGGDPTRYNVQVKGSNAQVGSIRVLGPAG